MRQRAELFFEHGGLDRVRRRVLAVGELVGQQLPENDANAEEIAPWIDLRRLRDLLGAGVAICADEGVGHGDARGIDDLCHAEVEELRGKRCVGVAKQEDVVRLHVAVDRVCGVCGLERAGDLEAKLADLLDGHHVAFTEPVGQVDAFEELHQHGGHAFDLDQVHDARDVGMLDRAHEPSLSPEALADAFVACEVGLEELHCEAVLQLEPAHLIDNAHATDADLSDDLVSSVYDIAFLREHRVGGGP